MGTKDMKKNAILRKKAEDVIEILKGLYPQAFCSLAYEKDYELLLATRLSAQCTDARVNLITPELFSRYPTLQDIASAELSELEAIVRPCGFFHTKARDIIACAGEILSRFEGRVPSTMDELLSLPGVGRKTANLILGDIYRVPAIVTDTHCIRISNRLGLCASKDPYKVELALREIVEPEDQSDLCHRFVLFGRDICRARSPLCEGCPLSALCEFAQIS